MRGPREQRIFHGSPVGGSSSGAHDRPTVSNWAPVGEPQENYGMEANERTLQSMGDPRGTRGRPIRDPWKSKNTHGIPMGNHERSMEAHWRFMEVHGSPWETHESPWEPTRDPILSMRAHGRPMYNLRDTHGRSMGHP